MNLSTGELAARVRDLALLLDLSNLVGITMEMPRMLNTVLPRIIENLSLPTPG